MSPSRALWLGSPHLLRAEGGPEAMAAFRRLPEGQQREVVGYGDRLAEVSLALAHAYALKAPQARQQLDRHQFAAWATLAVDLGGARLANRDAAAAYLHLDPGTLLEAGRKLLDRWIGLCGKIQEVSRKLAVLFLEGSGPKLHVLGDRASSHLEAWADAGLRLASRSGWRGEFLAAAYFASGPTVLPGLSTKEIAPWVDLGVAVQSGREVFQEYFQRLPEGFSRLSAADREALFGLCRGAASEEPRSGAKLFAELPAILAELSPLVRRPLLGCFAPAVKHHEALLGVAPLIAAIVGSIPEAERVRLFERVAETAERLPSCVVPLLRSVPRAHEAAGSRGIRRWIEHGEAIAAENPEAGRTYFALESRTALRYLREGSAAVRLEEVEPVLRSFVRMLSGQSLTLRGADGPSLRPFLDVESLERMSLALPDQVDLFGSWEDNFAILKLASANGVGRLFFGTYDLSIAKVAARLPGPLAAVLSSSVAGDTLFHLLEVVPEADPLLTLFAACDGARVDCRMRSRYRGYAAELGSLARRLARIVPRSRRSAELVLYLVGAGVPVAELATDQLPAEVIAPVAQLLAAPTATVEDALAVAIQLRERLGDSIAISGFGPQSAYEELLFERMTGETVIEPAPQAGEETGERPRPTEVLDLDPAAVEEGEEDGRGTPLSPEELRRLLEAGAIVKVGRSGDMEESAGIFAKTLSLPPGPSEEAAEGEGAVAEAARRGGHGRADQATFEYDEWDYQIRDYRPRWCRLEEVALGGDAGEFFQGTLVRYADLLPEVRRQFQRIRPERYRKVRGLEDGEDFDLNAVVNARVEMRGRRSPSPRLYVARRTEERDVATLFLLDMSASTDEALSPPEEEKRGHSPFSLEAGVAGRKKGNVPFFPPQRPRRIIDVTKEALVIMAEALEELGDRYAIYGFSGQGRDNVEFYLVKHFNEGLNPRVRGRIGGIEPRRSTRMGTALRHALTKMTNVTSRSRHIFLLSDGFPQDFDYGADRRSNTYGIQDTMVALQECQAAGVTPFCITVDKTGHDYLRQMCETSRYLVIDDVAALPTELPKIYERWIRA